MFLSIAYTCVEFISYLYVIVRLHRNYSQITLTDAFASVFYLIYGFWAMVFTYIICFCVVKHMILLNIARMICDKFTRSIYYVNFIIFVNDYKIDKIENGILILGDIVRNIVIGSLIKLLIRFCEKDIVDMMSNNNGIASELRNDDIRRFNDRIGNIIQGSASTILQSTHNADKAKHTIIKDVGGLLFGEKNKEK